MKFSAVLLMIYFLVTGCQPSNTNSSLQSEATPKFESAEDVFSYLKQRDVRVTVDEGRISVDGKKALVDAFNLRHAEYQKLIRQIKGSVHIEFANIGGVQRTTSEFKGMKTLIVIDISDDHKQRPLHKVIYRQLAYSAHLSVTEGDVIEIALAKDFFKLIPSDDFWEKVVPGLHKISDKITSVTERLVSQADFTTRFQVLSVNVEFTTGKDKIRFYERYSSLSNTSSYIITFEINPLVKGVPGIDAFLNNDFDFDRLKKSIRNPANEHFKLTYDFEKI